MIKQVGLSQCQRIVSLVKCSHSIFIGYSCTLIKSLLPCGSLSGYIYCIVSWRNSLNLLHPNKHCLVVPILPKTYDIFRIEIVIGTFGQCDCRRDKTKGHQSW